MSFADNRDYPCIGPEGVRAIAASPKAARLRSLDVSSNALGDREARALLESPYLRGLQTLILGCRWDENFQESFSESVHAALKLRFGKDVTWPN